MKIQLSSPLVLLLLPALTTAADLNSAEPGAHVSSGSSEFNSRYVAADVASINAAKGSQDVPVDGKDGKPHDGPWVETAAERDRKKEKADKKTYTVADTEQVGNSVGLDGKNIPNSNEGVMDDPSRLGPKEGTRGTEGGMTEKTKDTKQYKDKKPETPKEARPLPHSEQEKIPGYEDSSEVTDQKTGDTLLEVRFIRL